MPGEQKMMLNKLGKVELIRTDRNDDYTRTIDSRARDITKCIKMNNQLFDVLCDFVLKFTDKNEYNRSFSQWLKDVRKSNRAVKQGDLEILINTLKAAYKNSKDDREISDLRGRILETIYQNELSPIYSKRDSIFDYGCKVIINEVEIKYIDGTGDFDRNRSTIDIAGYNLKKSEFYELKVRPAGFQDNIIIYLNKLKSKAFSNEISENIIVGCVSLEPKTSLKNQLKIIKNKYNVDYEGLKIVGKDEIRELIKTG